MVSQDRKAAALALATAAFMSMPAGLGPSTARAQNPPRRVPLRETTVRAQVMTREEPAEYVRICDTYGTGFFYIPGTDTCLQVRDYRRNTVERASQVNGAGTVQTQPEPVEHVRICDVYGSGYYYIPGTDTCLNVAGSVRTTVSPASAGGTDAMDGPAFSLSAGANYVFGGKQKRGVGATEFGGVVINPAFFLDDDADGAEFSLGGRISLPDSFGLLGGGGASLGFGLEHADLDGEGSASNLSFPNGFGFPSVGQMPGVFIGSPTDVTEAHYDFDLNRTAAYLHWKQTIFDDFDSFGAGNSGSLYGLFGVRGGAYDQDDSVWGQTFTPAFGLAGLTDFRYDTEFDGTFFGAYAGLGWRSRYALSDGPQPIYLKTGLQSTIGIDRYGFDINDRLRIDGLGGLINVDTENSFDESDSQVTADLSASVGFGTDRWSLYLTGGLNYGKYPELEYSRPDSDPIGTPLRPRLDLEGNTSYFFGVRGSVNLPTF